MARLFGEDGRTLIVAMDHGSAFGVLPGLEKPEETIRAVVDAGADAILSTFGMATAFAEAFGRAGLILRMDRTIGGSSAAARLTYQVEDAMRIGADAVACMGFPGSTLEHDTLQILGQLAARCEAWKLPLMAEMLPQGFDAGPESRTVEAIRSAVRIGAELGADLIKTQYTGTIDGFRMVTDSCYVPVVVLGGPRMDSERDLLRVTKEAIDGGASGVAIGRNVWGTPRAGLVTRALAALIHGGATLEAAERLL